MAKRVSSLNTKGYFKGLVTREKSFASRLMVQHEWHCKNAPGRVYDGTLNHKGTLRMSTPESNSWKANFSGGVAPHVDARWPMRYGVACGVALAAFLLRLTIFGHLDTRLPFGFFLVGVMVAAWYGGLGPGLFVTVAGLLLGGYFFLPRTGATVAMGEAERTAILVFVINAALISFLMDNLHARIKKLECDKAKNIRQPPDAEN